MRTDTLQAIGEFDIKTIGNKKNIEKAETLVLPDEKILFISPTNMVITSNSTLKQDKLPGIIILTDKRIIFYCQIMANASAEIIPLDELRSISSNAGMAGGHVKLYTMTKSYDILVSYKREAVQKIVQTFENAKNKFTASITTPTVVSVSVPENQLLNTICFGNSLSWAFSQGPSIILYCGEKLSGLDCIYSRFSSLSLKSSFCQIFYSHLDDFL